MKSFLRWVGLYLMHLLAATLGILLATGLLLNVVLKPILQSHIDYGRFLTLVAKGPYYPLMVVLAALAGYFCDIRFKGNYRFWVWVVPTLYLAIKIILWTPPSALENYNWSTSLAHFFKASPPRYPEGNVTIPFYTSLSYTLGALLDAGNVFRFQRPSDEVGSAGTPPVGG